MKGLKKTFLAVSMAGLIGVSGLAAFAEGIGVVDLDKVVANYQQAQDVSADLKVKEAELQKFLADAQKQLKDAKTPIEKKNLEDKLTQEFKSRSEVFRNTQIKQWKQVEDNVFESIEQVSKAKKFDAILNKSAVLYGGTEVTDNVLTILNTKK